MVARVDDGSRSYDYVGPAELTDLVSLGGVGMAMATFADFSTWVADRSAVELEEPFTFVVDLEGFLRLAPRRSEHVVCAGGEPVLGAGEIGFARRCDGWVVSQVSNQSTGYCPDLKSWGAVAAALDRIGLPRPSAFTHEVVFRWCSKCDELNVVKEGYFVCVFCESDLPTAWNVGCSAGARRLCERPSAPGRTASAPASSKANSSSRPTNVPVGTPSRHSGSKRPGPLESGSARSTARNSSSTGSPRSRLRRRRKESAAPA